MAEKDENSPKPEPRVDRASQALLDAQAAGERVVCAMSPYAGNPVQYDPRSTKDPKPWVLAGWTGRRDDWYRYTASECRVAD